jgi:T5SS/PEP-CTERM-associated repeat protein
MKSSSPFSALLLAGLLALAFKAHAGYDAATWSPVDIVTDGAGNHYAYWNDPTNWNTGVVPTFTNSVDGNLWGVHFAEPAGAIIPCVISNNTQVGQVVVGDYGRGGYLIISNGASFTAGTADGNWTGVGYPNGPGTLYVGTGSVVTLGSHLWVGNGTGAQGTVIVDGGTLNIPNGELGVGWNGTGGTNYLTISNGGKVFCGQWNPSSFGPPGNPASLGILNLSDSISTLVITGNQTSSVNNLVTNNQFLAYGGQGTVNWSYNPVANTTTLAGVAPHSGPPPILFQPTNVVVALGATSAFSVATNGSGNFNYQWLFNNQPLSDGNGISGTKTATLTITGVTAADVGYYSVLVSLASQSVESSFASLSADAFTFYPVVTVNGVPGNTYEVDFTTSQSSPVWTPLTTVTLSSFTQSIVDTATPMSLVRFYRVVQH